MMQDQTKIYFKLELIKKNKQLAFNVHFNPLAENISADEHTISWSPTKQEQNFLLEALELLRNQEINNTIVFHKTTEYPNTLMKEPLTPFIKESSNEQNDKSQQSWESIDRSIDKTLRQID